MSTNNTVEIARMNQNFSVPQAPPDPKFMEIGMLNDAMFRFEEMIKRSQMETASMVQKQMNDMKASMDAMTSPGSTTVLQEKQTKGDSSKSSPDINDKASSEITVYTNAIKGPSNLDKKCDNNMNNFSSSDEEVVNTSDENMDFQNNGEIQIEMQMDNEPTDQEILNFITENRPENDRRTVVIQKKSDAANTRVITNEPVPGTSKQDTPDQRADRMIKEAETVKARILDAPGRDDTVFNISNMSREHIDIRNNFVHSAMVDESFLLVASHLDQATYDKIVNSEYVDFARLILKDKVLLEYENRLQMINKDGQMFFVPANGDRFAINNFSRWEQAFRVFSDVYTRAHPSRSSELVQYNHIIHTASLSYTWDNVYMYDKDFRLHMSRHPARSWALLLQQAWALRLKDKIRTEYGATTPNRPIQGTGNGNGSGGCRRFNRGKCTYGHNCRYEHRCFYCNKNGHGVVTCRQLRYDKSDRNDRYHKDNRFEGSNNQNSNGYGGGDRHGYGGSDRHQYSNHSNNFNNTTHNQNNNNATPNHGNHGANAKQQDKK